MLSKMWGKIMVLPGGIGPTTSPLPRECSTTELRQPNQYARAPLPQMLALCNPLDYSQMMNQQAPQSRVLARKEREAQALKANLQRRKEQQRLQASKEPAAKQREDSHE